MSKPELTLEVLIGPLDGAKVVLTEDTAWSRNGDGPLAFPWDAELGEPQAMFSVDEQGWWIESVSSLHGTYRLMRGKPKRIRVKTLLSKDDVLKASMTLLLVC